jgi:hypothetical protein
MTKEELKERLMAQLEKCLELAEKGIALQLPRQEIKLGTETFEVGIQIINKKNIHW